MSFEPGELVGGRYELGRQLGAGGMARVYLGHDRILDRQVAVKVLSEPYASDPQFVERFRREASAAAGLSHPNIVAVYDRGEADGSYYIVMEYLRGPDLKQVIRSRAPLPATEAIDNAQQILAALGAAHRSDLVHRDVKPQNVMVAEDGHLKVTDFGIARAGAESDMTEAGSVIGTAQYLSPEQARGNDVTSASDCYSVGIVLYEMLTGRVPFDGGPPVAVAMKQITDEPVSPRIVEPSVPRELEVVVLRALAKRPSERYRTAEEMSRALTEARSAIDGSGGTTRVIPAAEDTGRTRVIGPTAGATRVAPPPPSAPPAPRRRWPLVVGALVLLVAIAVGAFALLSGGGGAKTVAVPRVEGLTEAAAVAALEDVGLKADVRTVTDQTAEAGTAIETVPAEGESAKEGDTVILRVSGGPGDTTVPDVAEQDEAAATSALKREDFVVETRDEASETIEKGFVIRTEPAAQTRVERGSTVTLILSSGPEAVTVRNVTGIGQAEAEQTLRGQGFKVKVARRPTTDFAPGIVIEQDPGGGTRAPKGSAVTITVAVAPSNVTVPGVIGLGADEARTTLEDLGLRVTSDTAESDEPVGTVIDQEPGEGTGVAPNSRVVITVSDGPGTSEPSVQPPPPGEPTP